MLDNDFDVNNDDSVSPLALMSRAHRHAASQHWNEAIEAADRAVARWLIARGDAHPLGAMRDTLIERFAPVARDEVAFAELAFTRLWPVTSSPFGEPVTPEARARASNTLERLRTEDRASLRSAVGLALAAVSMPPAERFAALSRAYGLWPARSLLGQLAAISPLSDEVRAQLRDLLADYCARRLDLELLEAWITLQSTDDGVVQRRTPISDLLAERELIEAAVNAHLVATGAAW